MNNEALLLGLLGTTLLVAGLAQQLDVSAAVGAFLVGIALSGTVLPGIVKQFYRSRSGAVTGLYLLAMMVGATAASALTVPLADALGSWQRSLAVWAVLAVLGLGVAVLKDPELAESPASAGTWRWGGAYGHSWFVDPVRRLSVVALTNTAVAGNRKMPLPTV